MIVTNSLHNNSRIVGAYLGGGALGVLAPRVPKWGRRNVGGAKKAEGASGVARGKLGPPRCVRGR